MILQLQSQLEHLRRVGARDSRQSLITFWYGYGITTSLQRIWQVQTQAKISRDFAYKHNLKYFFDEKDMGIEHALLPEKGCCIWRCYNWGRLSHMHPWSFRGLLLLVWEAQT